MTIPVPYEIVVDETLWNSATTDADILEWTWANVEMIKQQAEVYRAQRPAILGEDDLSDEQLANWVFLSFETLNRVRLMFVSAREAVLEAAQN